MNLAIIGDSFSSDSTPGSWVDLLGQRHQLTNYSLRGISQYRMFDILTKNLSDIMQADTIIIWHTNPDRVYINNEIVFPTRKLPRHPYADLVAADSLDSCDKEWQTITKNYYKVFHSQEQQAVYYQLILEKINSLLLQKTVIHCSGFDLATASVKIKSFNYLLHSNPGPTNHYDIGGNQIVFEYLISRL